MAEASTILIVAGVAFLGGFLKAIAGLGFSTVALALLAILLDPLTAIAVVTPSALIANIWQASSGGHGTEVLKRIWPLLVTGAAAVWIGISIMALVDVAVISTFLGLSLIVQAHLMPAGGLEGISTEKERWAGPTAGLANGVLAGMTGSLVVPGVMYLQFLGLSRAAFIQAMGLHFTTISVVLSVALWVHGLLTPSLGVLSIIAALAALAAMTIGAGVRHALADHLFHGVFVVSLIAIGGYMAGPNINDTALFVWGVLRD